MAGIVMEKIPHIPVLLDEVLSVFEDMKNGTFVDCTLGYGGHSEAILKNFPDVSLIGIDQDIEAIEFSKNRLSGFSSRFRAVRGRYSEILPDLDFSNISGILADIGVSSLQLDKRERGFNFFGETLDMRMDQSREFSAYDVVNRYTISELEEIFLKYGEERAFKKIAKLIADERKKAPIKSAAELSSLIERHHKCPGIHPATRIFQAIRIEVNDELGELTRFLNTIKEKHRKDMIVAVITFHSLEDRMVKNSFKEWSRKCVCPLEAFRCECGNDNELGTVLSKKPLTASKRELKENVRSRSAKLRAFKFTRDAGDSDA